MRSDSPVLGFDCAAPHCAAALAVGDRIIAARRDEMTRGQVEHLMPMLQELLTSAGLDWRDLAALGVGTGPGNFTGTRIAISAARGLALGLGVPAIGVSVLEAQVHGVDAPCLSLAPGPRDQVYVQGFGPGLRLGPVLCTPGPDSLPDAPPALCIGHRADDIAALISGQPRAAAGNVAENIARIAALRRFDAGIERPAPVYLAPPAAAPAADPPPVILS